MAAAGLAELRKQICFRSADDKVCTLEALAGKSVPALNYTIIFQFFLICMYTLDQLLAGRGVLTTSLVLKLVLCKF